VSSYCEYSKTPCLILQALSREQLRERNAWLDVPDSFDDEDAAVGGYEDDILHGRVAAEISHAGEGVQEEAAADSQTLLEKLRAHHKCVLFPFFFWGISLI
jgi:alkylhydroperoxidase family enzyme